jgi:hypothetical protein
MYLVPSVGILLHRRHKGSMKMTDEKLSNREERI